MLTFIPIYIDFLPTDFRDILTNFVATDGGWGVKGGVLQFVEEVGLGQAYYKVGIVELLQQLKNCGRVIRGENCR